MICLYFSLITVLSKNGHKSRKAMVMKVENPPLECKLPTFLWLNRPHLQMLKLAHPAHSCFYLMGSATNPLPNSHHTPQSSVHMFQSFWQFY